MRRFSCTKAWKFSYHIFKSQVIHPSSNKTNICKTVARLVYEFAHSSCDHPPTQKILQGLSKTLKNLLCCRATFVHSSYEFAPSEAINANQQPLVFYHRLSDSHLFVMAILPLHFAELRRMLCNDIDLCELLRLSCLHG